MTMRVMKTRWNSKRRSYQEMRKNDYLWEEDPRYQEANYRCFLFIALFSIVVVATWSGVTGEWAWLGYWMRGLAIFILALCGYAALVWIIANLVLLAAKLNP